MKQEALEALNRLGSLIDSDESQEDYDIVVEFITLAEID